MDTAPSNDDPADDGTSDCFAPPKIPCECFCLHCQRTFMSDGIWFQKVINGRDGFTGFWLCPTPNCDGAGFTFDIFPTDPAHPANESWTYDDDEEDDDDDDDPSAEYDPESDLDHGDDTKEYDPAEPHYAKLDEQYGDDDDDIEGEEWKHGLEPGERPPPPPRAEEAHRHWEEQQKRYDMPDERPRVRDLSKELPPHPPGSSSDSDDTIDESDIPF